MDSKSIAPIVVFGYNRPKHIEKCLNALAANTLAIKSDLFILIDGPKNESDQAANDEVVRFCKAFDWPGSSKEVRLRSTNYGLADNIIEGVTSLIKSHDKLIVVEDDLETSAGFLSYMNEALELYQDQQQVMHISAYMFPIKPKTQEETLFYQISSCWGWATWSNRWSMLNTDPRELHRLLEERSLLHRFDLDGSGKFLSQLTANIEKSIRTWAIKWQATITLNNGLCLHPRKSLSRNIGFDGSGVHCNKDQDFGSQSLADMIKVELVPLEENLAFREQMKKYYSHVSMEVRLKNNLRRLFAKLSGTRAKWHTIASGPGSGKKIFINKRAFPGWSEMIQGEFDRFLFDEIARRGLRPKKLFDIGSHFGYHTLCLATLFPQAQIVAIEPNPANAERLRLHIEKNDLSRIDVMELAVSDRKGRATFQMSDNLDSSHSTGSYLNDVDPPLTADHYSDFTSIDVDIETIKGIVASSGVTPDLIKMDIEGGELDAINGSLDFLISTRPVLCIEAHSRSLKKGLFDLLDSYYDIDVIEEDDLRSFLFCTSK